VKRASYLRIRIAPTRRTDLACIVCGCFRTELAIIPLGGDASRESADSQAGIHRACRDSAHQKKQTKVPAAPTRREPPSYSFSPRAMLAGDICDPEDDDAQRELDDEMNAEKTAEP
jgi:hypothetical protein